MGKGDKKTARGKRIIGSSGVKRQRKKAKYTPPAAPVKKATPKKAAAKKETAPKKTTAKKAAPKKTAAKKTTKKEE